MRNFELDKLNMYLVVKAGLNKNIALWQDNLPLTETIHLFYAKTEELLDVTSLHNVNLTGYTSQKAHYRKLLEEQLLFIAMQLRAYATITQNENLFNQIRTSKSALHHQREKELVYDADTLHDLATEHLAGIVNLGVSADLLNQLQTLITQFTNAINQPVKEHQLKQEATIHLKIIIKEIDNLLKNRLDPQMLMFKSRKYDFYLNYRFNRKIVGSPTIKTAMRIKVVDKLTQAPLPKARITIADHHIKRNTSPLGQIVIRNLKEMEHIITAEHSGYRKETPRVVHVKGETTIVLVEMEREG